MQVYDHTRTSDHMTVWAWDWLPALNNGCMESRDSKQWREDATRHNSASEASLLLKFYQKSSHEILVMLMPSDFVCTFPASHELFLYIAFYWITCSVFPSTRSVKKSNRCILYVGIQVHSIASPYLGKCNILAAQLLLLITKEFIRKHSLRGS